jgi:hypothetical protein
LQQVGSSKKKPSMPERIGIKTVKREKPAPTNFPSVVTQRRQRLRELVVHLDAFDCWAETNLTPRVWAVRDDAQERAQRSDELVRRSRDLLRRHQDAEHRQGAFAQPYVLQLSTDPTDKLLAIVNRDLERTVDVLPNAYHRACWAWFNSLSPANRITAELAGRSYLDGAAAAAGKIAAQLPRAPVFPFLAVATALTPASPPGRRPRRRERRERADG